MTAAFDQFIAGLAATSPLEALAVILGLGYSVLAVRRNRWCWVSGGVSSTILVYLFAERRLPMQAALQAYYVAMSFYGFIIWAQEQKQSTARVTTWPVRVHLLAWGGILILSACSSRWLAAETGAAWPFLDSVTTWASLFATWLVVRMKLENWLYWIAIDVVLVYLTGAQKLLFVSLMFAAYLAISVTGFVTWLKTERLQTPAG
jgi:nicotinamide mononucleotide transporter